MQRKHLRFMALGSILTLAVLILPALAIISLSDSQPDTSFDTHRTFYSPDLSYRIVDSPTWWVTDSIKDVQGQIYDQFASSWYPMFLTISKLPTSKCVSVDEAVRKFRDNELRITTWEVFADAPDISITTVDGVEARRISWMGDIHFRDYNAVAWFERVYVVRNCETWYLEFMAPKNPTHPLHRIYDASLDTFLANFEFTDEKV